jgi:hypothetical protein
MSDRLGNLTVETSNPKFTMALYPIQPLSNPMSIQRVNICEIIALRIRTIVAAIPESYDMSLTHTGNVMLVARCHTALMSCFVSSVTLFQREGQGHHSHIKTFATSLNLNVAIQLSDPKHHFRALTTVRLNFNILHILLLGIIILSIRSVKTSESNTPATECAKNKLSSTKR